MWAFLCAFLAGRLNKNKPVTKAVRYLICAKCGQLVNVPICRNNVLIVAIQCGGNFVLVLIGLLFLNIFR